MIQKLFVCFVLSFSTTLFCQEIKEVSLIKATKLKTDNFIGIDDFGAIYHIKNNVLYKKTDTNTISYNNLQLGNLSNVDILNPLEITVFYTDFNTVIKLDNTLNEIIKIDFNQTKTFKNVQFATTAISKNIWIFNTDLQQLELFNHQTKKSFPIHQPLAKSVIVQKSNYNFCWLLTKTQLFHYNNYGSLINKIPMENFEDFCQSNGNIILKKKNKLFFLEKDSESRTPLTLPKIIVKDFYLNGENLYIYDGELLHQFQLKPTKQ